MPLACAPLDDVAGRRPFEDTPPALVTPVEIPAKGSGGAVACSGRFAGLRHRLGAGAWHPADALFRAGAVLVLSAAAVAATPSAVDLGDGAPVALAGLAASVTDWTAAASGLPKPAALPVVMRVSRSEMAALRYGSRVGVAGLARVVALYDRRGGRILLAEDWTGATPEEVSVLVHELVHHLEAAAGIVPACPAAGEARAYATQAAWLAGFGRDLRQGFGLDPLTLRLVTACSRLRR